MGETGLDYSTANYQVTSETFWVINELWEAFTHVVRIGQHRVPHTWVLNTGPGDYDICMTELHRQSGVARMRDLHGLMS